MFFTFIIVVILTAIVLVVAAMTIAKLLAPRSFNPQKGEPYECGIPTRGQSWSDRIACRLVVATLQRRDKPVPKLCVLPLEAARLILYRERLSVVSPQQDTHDFVGKIFDRSVKVKAVALSQGLEIKLHDSAVQIEPHKLDRAARKRLGFVGYDKVGLKLTLEPQPRAVGARPERTVEGEHSRLQLLECHAAVGTGQLFGVHGFRVLRLDNDKPLRQFKRGFQTVVKPLGHILLDGQSVHNDANRMLVGLFELYFLFEQTLLSVHVDAHEALLFKAFKKLLKLAFASPDNGVLLVSPYLPN